jgi:hypothetical protein
MKVRFLVPFMPRGLSGACYGGVPEFVASFTTAWVNLGYDWNGT